MHAQLQISLDSWNDNGIMALWWCEVKVNDAMITMATTEWNSQKKKLYDMKKRKGCEWEILMRQIPINHQLILPLPLSHTVSRLHFTISTSDNDTERARISFGLLLLCLVVNGMATSVLKEDWALIVQNAIHSSTLLFANALNKWTCIHSHYTQTHTDRHTEVNNEAVSAKLSSDMFAALIYLPTKVYYGLAQASGDRTTARTVNTHPHSSTAWSNMRRQHKWKWWMAWHEFAKIGRRC